MSNKAKSKSKQSNPKTSILIKYDKNINKKDEFIVRVFERVIVKILGILENRRP